MPSVFIDIKTGLHYGWKPFLALLAVSAVCFVALITTQADVIAQGGYSAPGSEDIPDFVWLSLTLNFAWYISIFLTYCWFLTSWIRSEFGLAAPLEPIPFFRHVAARQFLAGFISCMTTFFVAIPVLLIIGFSVFPAIVKTVDSTPTSLGGVLGSFLPVFIIMAVAAFFLCMLGTYLFLRCSVGLSVTARTGVRFKLGGSFQHCGQAAPRKSILWASVWLTVAILVLPLAINAIAFSLIWLIFPSELNAVFAVNSLAQEQATQMAESNSILALQGLLSLFTLVSVPFCAALVLIRLSRQVPAEIESTGS